MCSWNSGHACTDLDAPWRQRWRAQQNQDGRPAGALRIAQVRRAAHLCTVQSGNVIFRTKEKNSPALAKKVQDAIERKFGFRPAVILRTAAELRSAIAATPFARS